MVSLLLSSPDIDVEAGAPRLQAVHTTVAGPRFSQLSVIRLLLNAAADPNREGGGFLCRIPRNVRWVLATTTPIEACTLGDPVIVTLLYSSGGDATTVSEGRTPLGACKDDLAYAALAVWGPTAFFANTIF